MELSRRFDGKKFMWDGETYAGNSQAQQAVARYESDGFMTRLVPEQDQFFVFTRREVKETVEAAKS